MSVTVRRIHLSRDGYAVRGGRYWGTGERLYYCPELEAHNEWTALSHRRSAYTRAESVSKARATFKASIEYVKAHPWPPAAI